MILCMNFFVIIFFFFTMKMKKEKGKRKFFINESIYAYDAMEFHLKIYIIYADLILSDIIIIFLKKGYFVKFFYMNLNFY